MANGRRVAKTVSSGQYLVRSAEGKRSATRFRRTGTAATQHTQRIRNSIQRSKKA